MKYSFDDMKISSKDSGNENGILVFVTNMKRTLIPGTYGISDYTYTFVNGIEGKPQGSDTYSSEEFEKMGMVGIYKREGDKSFKAVRRSVHPDLDFNRLL